MMNDETVDAEIFVNKAMTLMSEVNMWQLQLRYKVCVYSYIGLGLGLGLRLGLRLGFGLWLGGAPW